MSTSTIGALTIDARRTAHGRFWRISVPSGGFEKTGAATPVCAAWRRPDFAQPSRAAAAVRAAADDADDRTAAVVVPDPAAARRTGGARTAAAAQRALVPAAQGQPGDPRDQRALQHRAAGLQAHPAAGADRPPVPRPAGAGRRRGATPPRRTCRSSWRASAPTATRARSCRRSMPTSISASATGWRERSRNSLYRVRLGYADDERCAGISPKSTVVFVINHRCNFDYVLVAFLAAERVALSYAVGEWARVWPLQIADPLDGRLLRAPQLRRPALPHRALQRYVQMATEAGVTQAVFPGRRPDRRRRTAPAQARPDRLHGARLRPGRRRDVVFIPVGINYDRVLEDRTPAAEARRPRAAPRPACAPCVTTLLSSGATWADAAPAAGTGSATPA